MGKIERQYKLTLRIVLFLLVVCFAVSSLADNGGEGLLKQAKQIFGPLPQVMLSEKNPITPKRLDWGRCFFMKRGFCGRNSKLRPMPSDRFICGRWAKEVDRE